VIAYSSAIAGPLIVAPVGFGEVGVHNLEVVLWDYSAGTSGYTKTPWTVTVTNTAPFFNVPILPNATIQMNFIGLYSVSTLIQDDEGHNAILSY
jgi:hypothetical protein